MSAVASLLLAVSLAVAHGVASAADLEGAPTLSFADRFANAAARIEALSEADLKEFYLNCARASVRERVSPGEIQLCSIGYERLLHRSFGGDFRALLEWRRDAARRRLSAPAPEPPP